MYEWLTRYRGVLWRLLVFNFSTFLHILREVNHFLRQLPYYCVFLMPTLI
jgi:hypothetical protein